MRTKLLTALLFTLLTSLVLANPLEEPFIQEISIDPPWIEVICWDPDFLVGQTITTRQGSAEILSAEPNENSLLVLDSSNTTGFILHPDGDSIIFTNEYERFCDRIGYGTYGDAAGAPLPGTSIKACFDVIYEGEGQSYQYWFFAFCLMPTPGEYHDNYIYQVYWGDSKLVLNEISFNNDWHQSANFIELYNAGDEAISTNNYSLWGDVCYNLPAEDIVYPGQYYRIEENECPGLFNFKDSDVLYLTTGDQNYDSYYIVDQVGWDSPFALNSSFIRYPDGDVDWNEWNDFRGYNTETSYTFENGFPTRGATNRHESPGFVTIAVRADSLDEGQAMISWTDPIWDDQFDYSVLVKSTGGYAETPNDGDILYSGADQQFIDEVIEPGEPSYYTVFAYKSDGEYSTPTEESQAYILFNAMDIDDPIAIPESYSSLSCYPNPFNAQTTISFSLAEQSNVEISIYDITGRLIEIVANEHYAAGKHSISWHAGNYSSGIYFARLNSNDGRSINKMILLK